MRAADDAELIAPGDLHVGAHVEASLLLTPDDAELPILVTPSTEGDAVAVVQGRLTRADADVLDDGRLRFRIPLVANTAGTGVLHVRVESFACAARCRPTVRRLRTLLTVNANR
ncbi:MAG: hypothetical protein KC417_00170 [Myxococcales bacterium]|nr:hypothetical protein [Myxococcales bacterium]